MKEYNVLTEQEIADKLANMRVDTGEYLPIKMFSFIILNPDYNPNDFSEEIENSEEFINTLDLEIKEIRKSGFDFVWNNTMVNIPKNSDKWLKNHTKKCKYKLLKNVFMMSCANWSNGTRNYCYKDVYDKIKEKVPYNIVDII